MDTRKSHDMTPDELLKDMTTLRNEAVAHGHDLDAMLQAVADPMVVYDLQTQIVRANPAFHALLTTFSHAPTASSLQERADGLAMRDLQGDLLPDQEWPQHRMLHGEAITDADPAQIITRGESGRDGVFSITGGPLYHDEQVTGAVAFFRDITEQQQLKGDLSQSREELQVIFDTLSDPLFYYDATGRLAQANPAARRLLPLETTAYSALPLSEPAAPYHVRDDQGQPLAPDQWPIARLLRGEPLGGEDEAPIRIDLPDGREILLSYSGAPICDADGRVTGYVTLAHDITARKQMEEALRRAKDELESRVDQRTHELAVASRVLQRLSQRVLEVQEAERRRVARELHDEIGQALTGVNMMLELLDAQLTHTDSPAGDTLHDTQQVTAENVPHLDEVRVAVSDALERVRELSLALRPAMLDSLGLLPALHWQFERYTKQTGVQVNFQQSGLEQRLPGEIETGAYRLIQEALTNVARYADVAAVTVQVLATAETLTLFVVDDGLGFDVEAALEGGRSTGLASMRERADLLGGTLLITSAPGDGTTIEAELPLLAAFHSLEAVSTQQETGSKRDNDHDTTRDIARDVPRDALRDVARDSARDTQRDQARDRERDSTRDIGRDVLRDVARDVARDAAYEQDEPQRSDTADPRERDT